MQKTCALPDALAAQKALRDLAGLEPEIFPIPAFVGMISDEIETLRSRGISDEQIAAVIRQHSSIDITAEDVSKYYAPPELRHS